MAQAHHEYVYCTGHDGDEARSEESEKEFVQDQQSEVTGESITFEEHLKSSGVADSISVGELKGGFQVLTSTTISNTLYRMLLAVIAASSLF